MALFKIFKGAEEDLNDVPLHEGYAYFCEDTGNLFIDVSNIEGGRLQVNAYAAQVLKNNVTEIDIDDIFLKNMTATVAQGGTGHDTLTVNALLVGNGTEALKMIEIACCCYTTIWCYKNIITYLYFCSIQNYQIMV